MELKSIPSVKRLRKHHNLQWNWTLIPFLIRKHHNLLWNLTLPSSLQTIPRRRPWRFSCGHACSHGFVGTPAYFFGRSLKRSTVGTPACVPFTTSPRPLFSDSSSFFFFFLQLFHSLKIFFIFFSFSGHGHAWSV